jgi:hypothetical protein
MAHVPSLPLPLFFSLSRGLRKGSGEPSRPDKDERDDSEAAAAATSPEWVAKEAVRRG